MASPFKFFRKYSGGMMIVMVILSMMLFTMDSLFSDPGKNLWLLGLLLGGTVFGIAGVGQGRWLQWGIGGAVLGVLMGLILPEFVAGDGRLSTSLGVISNQDMQDMQIRRRIANQFVVGATEASFGQGTGRFATLFGFGHPGNEDVVLGKLLRAEAEEMGITVDTTMVGDYLKRITSEKLTEADYVKTRNALSYNGRELTESDLQAILSDEIKARMAYQILRTRTSTLPPGPEVYWQYYRRLNVRQQIVTAALDVDDFVDDVAEPTDSDIDAMFAEFKTKFPNQLEPGSPGFRLPFRARVAYVELNSKSIEAGLDEITDAEIEAYYDEKKETPMIRTPILPDFPKTDEEKKAEAEDDDKPKDDAKSDDAKADDAKADDAKADDAKADDAKADDAKSDGKAAGTDEKKADSDTKPSAAAPAKEEKSDATPEKTTEEKKPEVETKPETEAAKEEAEAAPADAADAEPTEKEVDSTQIEVLEIDPGSEETSKEPAADSSEETTADEKAAEPAASPTKDDAAADDAAADDAAAEDAEDKKSAEAAPASAPLSLTIPDEPSEGDAAGTPPAAPEIKFEYRELNDELKQEIREELTREKVAAIVAEKLDGARKVMETLASDRASHRFSLMEDETSKYSFDNPKQQEALKELRESMADYNSGLDEKLKSFAAKNGFSYVETPLLSDMELYESEEYLIGKATEPVANPMMAAQSPSVASILYRSFSSEEQNNDAQMYFVRAAERASTSQDGSMSHYIYWATDFSTSHVPKLDEPGVEDAVAMALKRRIARDNVTARGDELAKLIREAASKEGDERQDMATVLKDQTVNGKEDGPAIAVRRSEPFSWLRTSSASPMNFQQQQASLSRISFSDAIGGSLEDVGDDFMKILFNEMKDEEVSVVPNYDFSKYYVVQVTNRFPTPEIGEDSLRERFSTEGQKYSFRDSPILSVMQQRLDGPASVEWEKSLWRKYGVDPDAEPDEE